MACISIGTGEMGPMNQPEFMFLTITMLIGLVLFSLFFSDIAVIVKVFSREAMDMQADTD